MGILGSPPHVVGCGKEGRGLELDTGLHDTAEAMAHTGGAGGHCTANTLGVQLWEEGSRVTYTHHLPKSCISKENPRGKKNSISVSILKRLHGFRV